MIRIISTLAGHVGSPKEARVIIGADFWIGNQLLDAKELGRINSIVYGEFDRLTGKTRWTYDKSDNRTVFQFPRWPEGAQNLCSRWRLTMSFLR